MSIIDIPNLKEIATWEGYFYVTWIFFKFCTKKYVKKVGQFSGTNILRNTEAIYFNFGMLSCAYVMQKIYKFGRNQCSSFRDTDGWIWQLYCTSNCTHLCAAHLVFLATDTLLCVLLTTVNREIFMWKLFMW